MIDVEVIRLRRLRATALKARAMAHALRADAAPRNSVWSRSAQTCWRIARVITGVLRAHPNLSYQQDYSPLRAVYGRAGADWRAAVARYRGRSAQALHEQLSRVSRELDDARALTWSAELSDTFGRTQLQMRRLLQELDSAAALETGSRDGVGVMLQPRAGSGTGNSNAVAGNWPYLAL